MAGTPYRWKNDWKALRADRSLLPRAVEEVLRWCPPNPYNRRTATRDVRLRNAQINAGDKVTLWWPSANRDETVFPHADTFDIRRAPNPHVTFGHGNHYCLGAEVARLEIGVLLETLLDRVAGDLRRRSGDPGSQQQAHRTAGSSHRAGPLGRRLVRSPQRVRSRHTRDGAEVRRWPAA
jgi:cytochrome P450